MNNQGEIGSKGKRVALIAHDDKFIKHFLVPHIKIFNDLGLSVTVITNNLYNSLENETGFDVNYISIQQSPFKIIKNSAAFLELSKILKNQHFDIVYAHTPVGGVLGRLIKISHPRAKIVYLPHGYHFFKKSGLKSWAIFYPVEKILSYFTNYIVTINNDDYNLTRKKMNHKANVYHINGVGVKLPETCDIENSIKNNDEFVITHIAELNDNKHQMTLLRAVNEIVNSPEYETLPKKIKVYIIGEGVNKDMYQAYVEEHQLSDVVEITGYQDDVQKYLKISNCAVSCSMREGLPVNMIESLSFGIPIVSTDCRGNRDVVKHGINGFIYQFNDFMTMKSYLLEVMNMSEEQTELIRKQNISDSHKYSLESVSTVLSDIFSEVIAD